MTQLTEKELEQKVKEAPLWELSPDRRSISRTFVAKNFAEGMVILPVYLNCK
jgi:pterin-4a-carbinolamine dehydratase